MPWKLLGASKGRFQENAGDSAKSVNMPEADGDHARLRAEPSSEVVGSRYRDGRMPFTVELPAHIQTDGGQGRLNPGSNG
jgi:hypothetical protein